MPSLRVNGISFNVELPYTEGHICTISEAAELNRVWLERIQAKARKIISISPSEAAIPSLEHMAESFFFDTKPFSLPPDPFQLECLKIAKSIAAERRAKDNFEWTEKAISALADSPLVREEAQRRIAANEAAAAKLINMEISI